MAHWTEKTGKICAYLQPCSSTRLESFPQPLLFPAALSISTAAGNSAQSPKVQTLLRGLSEDLESQALGFQVAPQERGSLLLQPCVPGAEPAAIPARGDAGKQNQGGRETPGTDPGPSGKAGSFLPWQELMTLLANITRSLSGILTFPPAPPCSCSFPFIYFRLWKLSFNFCTSVLSPGGLGAASSSSCTCW